MNEVRGLDQRFDAFWIDHLIFDHLMGNPVDLAAFWRDRAGGLAKGIEWSVLIDAHDGAGVAFVFEW